MLPGMSPAMMMAGGGSATLSFLNYDADEIDNVSNTSNTTPLVVPSNTTLIVGVAHVKNGSTCNVSTWTVNGIAYTSTGATVVNSSDTNGFTRLLIGYWLASATGTGSFNGVFTANKTCSYFHNYYIYFSGASATLGEADFEVSQSGVASNQNDFVALQPTASVIVHALGVHDNDSTAWTPTNDNLTGYTLLEKISSSNNEVHTQVGYVPRAAGSATSITNTASYSDNQSVGATCAVEFY